MSKSMITSSNPFLTESTARADVESLIEQGLALSSLRADGQYVCEYDKIDTPIGYNRGWLIVRYEWLVRNAPELLVPARALMAKAQVADSTADVVRTILGPIVADHKDAKQLSWGEIAVRLGLPEGMVRKAYRALDAKKDRGVRNGRGGRWVYDDQTLYQENRKAEGAWIPSTVVGRPQVEQLLNYKAPADAPKATPARKPRTPKAPATPKATEAEGMTQAQKKAARKAERAAAAQAS